MTGTFTWGDPDKRGSGAWGGGTAKVLRFPGVLTETGHAAVLSALARTARGPAGRPQREYPLTGHLAGLCGHTYSGVYRKDRDRAYYRCTARHTRKAGQPSCGCPHLVAADLETQVWQAVAGFLTNPDRLETLTREYAGLRDAQQTVERDELADVRRETARLGRALDETVTNGLREGLPARAAAAATNTLQADLDAANKPSSHGKPTTPPKPPASKTCATSPATPSPSCPTTPPGKPRFTSCSACASHPATTATLPTSKAS